MLMVRFKIKELMARHERIHRGKLSYQKISDGTGIPTANIGRLAANNIKQVPLEYIVKLCTYFKCDISDLMVLEDVDDITENNINIEKRD